MNEGNNPQGIADAHPGMSDADAEAIGNIFMDSADEQEDEESNLEPAEQEASEPEVEAAEADDTTNETSDEDETPEQAEIEPMELDPALVIKLADGSTTTAKELIEGNLRTADYTRKSQENAELKRQFEAEQAQLAEITTKANEERAFLVDYMQQMLPPEPELELRDRDPITYWAAKEDRDNQVNFIRGLMHQQEEARQQQQAQFREHQTQYKAAQDAQFLEMRPEFQDPAALKQFEDDSINVFARKYGFTDEEMAQTVNARFKAVIADNIRLHKLESQQAETVKQVQEKPKMLRNQPRKSRATRAQRDVNARIAEASRTGRTENLSDLIGELLG